MISALNVDVVGHKFEVECGATFYIPDRSSRSSSTKFR